ncbi:uncharacterized protein Dana_GF26559 [Drosophila ananassae]|uniref:C-type lectin domain-containing protein n=1 Tax=Drosophila ananassae TaxID=7217 RepID=A0A0N8NZG4_DROAN|nr:C-type lectin 37Da [Drosophila ananassae]KPU74252.1 uncharacterized protein Dana_GF26559 [Drosophila ananassae]
MSLKVPVVFAALVLICAAESYNIDPFIRNGIPESLHINTSPFIKIGEGYYYIETKTAKNWFDAFESCRRLDANLISFETLKEWDLINQYLWNQNLNHIYWTSGSDLANQGKHKWFASGEAITRNIWYPDEPNNQNGNENCDELGYRRTETNYNVLNDRPCNYERYFICETRQPKTAAFVIW